MEITAEQLYEFINLHKNCIGFDVYNEDQQKEIANGVANYYITFFKTYQRIIKDCGSLEALPTLKINVCDNIFITYNLIIKII